ncbi:major intrinsically disordered NOTCH2-binding receptor 1-like [Nelusetta ayraudi]|uniref:major intrinsically disordered NOTCH2-binding receptor 1-like n=1 Tax=Nelusetta ayraudi TaxID=303726 RepID=UPI003F6FC27C
MDVCVLSNNNSPEKFLQLEPKLLLMTSDLCWAQDHWRDQRASTAKRKDGCVLADRHLQKYGAEFTPKSNMKSNPLFTATRSVEQKNQAKVQPSWTIKEYKTQSLQWAQQGDVKDGKKTPADLDFWLEELYTPGFDSLLRNKKKKICTKNVYLCVVFLCMCGIIIVVVVPIVVLKKTN